MNLIDATTTELLELALAHIARLLVHSYEHKDSYWIDDCQVSAADFIGSGYIASSNTQAEKEGEACPSLRS